MRCDFGGHTIKTLQVDDHNRGQLVQLKLLVRHAPTLTMAAMIGIFSLEHLWRHVLLQCRFERLNVVHTDGQVLKCLKCVRLRVAAATLHTRPKAANEECVGTGVGDLIGNELNRGTGRCTSRLQGIDEEYNP